MKRKSKSAPLECLAAALCLLSLGGCEKVDWPHVYGPNEVPPSVQNTPRPFDDITPLAAGVTYPRLGDVPSKPKNFTPTLEIDQTKQQMEKDRTEGNTLLKQNQAATPPPSQEN